MFVTVWLGFVMIKLTALHCCWQAGEVQNSGSMNSQFRVIEVTVVRERSSKCGANLK